MKRFLFTLCAFLIATGCGDSAPSRGDVVAEQASNYCTRLTTCDLGNDALDRASVTSSAECTAQREADLRNDDGLEAFLADGSVVLSDANYDACVAALEAAPCTNFREVPACRNVYVGTLPADAGCVSDRQCVSGACTAVFDQCGTCLAPAEIGQACDLANDNCVASNDGWVDCRLDGIGATCVLDPVDLVMVTLDESCDDNHFCQSPYYCSQDGLCAERDPAGTACNPDFDSCELSAVCSDTGAGPTCLTIVNVTEVSQPCGPLAGGVSLGSCDSTLDLYCDGELCQQLAGAGAENSDCLKDADCSTGLICVDPGRNDPGTCETTNKVDGTFCEVDAECASQFCTENASLEKVCTARATCP